ncbi:hypothetical protein GYA01_00505 [Patescibacteria group bacterium]|nr:hypothetical protein [Patescibacteria group bacterium]
MKKKIVLLGVVIFLSTCFFICKNERFIEQGYSFEAPQDWEKTYETGVLTFLKGDDYIFFMKEELKGRSDSQYVDYIKAQIESSSESTEILEEKREGRFYVFYTRILQDEDNFIVGTALIKGLNDMYFVVSLKTYETTFENTKPVFEKVYKTFKLR